MKELKARLFREKNVCIFYLYNGDETYQEIIAKNHLEINIETKEVQKIHAFFQTLLVESTIEKDFENIDINYDLVKSEDFYRDKGFEKFKIFLSEQITVFNTTISEIKTELSD